jgi:hypothetical protein
VPATLERGPAPISHLAINDFIICVNTETRTNNAGSRDRSQNDRQRQFHRPHQ